MRIDTAFTRCDDGTDTYVGIMSYCTPRSQWWGWYDRLMLWWWF